MSAAPHQHSLDMSAEPGIGAVDAVQTAKVRLDAALTKLEAAVHRRLQDEKNALVLEKQVHYLSLDRARLAEEVDGLKDTAKALTAANAEVSVRIQSAMETVEAVLRDEAVKDDTSAQTPPAPGA